MKIDIITIFPEYLEPLKMSLIGKAVQIRRHCGRRARFAGLDPRCAPNGR